jgi:regulator of protease activity HflC (stomatin/prohibitin superfamily)
LRVPRARYHAWAVGRAQLFRSERVAAAEAEHLIREAQITAQLNHPHIAQGSRAVRIAAEHLVGVGRVHRAAPDVVAFLAGVIDGRCGKYGGATQ